MSREIVEDCLCSRAEGVKVKFTVWSFVHYCSVVLLNGTGICISTLQNPKSWPSFSAIGPLEHHVQDILRWTVGFYPTF
jgi:hypothetical protein